MRKKPLHPHLRHMGTKYSLSALVVLVRSKNELNQAWQFAILKLHREVPTPKPLA